MYTYIHTYIHTHDKLDNMMRSLLDKLIKFAVGALYRRDWLQTIYALERMVRRLLPTGIYLAIRRRATIHAIVQRRRTGAPPPAPDAVLSETAPKSIAPVQVTMDQIEQGLVIAPSAAGGRGGKGYRLRYGMVICVAFLGRHEVLRLVIDNLKESPLSLAWVLVGSSEEDVAFLQELGLLHDNIFGLRHDNNPLGKKWGFAVQAAEQLCRFDLLGITGSDDILSCQLLDSVQAQYRRDRQFKKRKLGGAPALYAVQRWFMLDLNRESPHHGALFSIAYKDDSVWMPVGAGRFYTGAFIRRFAAQLFDANKERLLDDDGYFKIMEQGEPIAFVEETAYPFISVKYGADELNAAEAILNAGTIYVQDCSLDKSLILNHFSAIRRLKGIVSDNKLKALVG